MTKWPWAAVVLVLTAAPVFAAPANPDLRVYGSVWVDEETGDKHGMEVELRTGPAPTAVVTWCDGDCYGGKIVPVRLSGQRISFTLMLDGLVDLHGRPAKPLATRYEGTLSEGTMSLTSPDRARTWREHLRRFDHPRPGQTAWLACGKPAC
jgi:hypothetical protein